MYEIKNRIDQISNINLQIYFVIVIISAIYFLLKFKKNNINIYIFLFFYYNIFVHIGGVIADIYKILILIFSLFLFLKHVIIRSNNVQIFFFNLSFLVLTVCFWTSVLINKTTLMLSFSQFSKFLNIYLLFFGLRYYFTKPNYSKSIIDTLILLLKIQIFLSVIKLIIIGANESIVGSVAYDAGSVAAIMPILGFILIWLLKNGNLKQNDWIFIVSLLIIGVASNKRAIWFIAPIIIVLFMFVKKKKKLSPKIILIIFLLLPAIFYIGIRINPTLNPERKFWGSFDMEFVNRYVTEYTFGNPYRSSNLAFGRGGGAIEVFSNIDFSKLEDIWGFGLANVYSTSYEDFDNKKYGIMNKGSASGGIRYFIAHGLLGFLSLMVFVISMISVVKNKRIRLIMYGFFLWEYLMYADIILRNNSLSLLFISILLISNQIDIGVLYQKRFTDK